MPTQLAQPSPKRKRDHLHPAPVPLLTTALTLRPAAPPPPRRPHTPPRPIRPTPTPPLAGDGDSPRTSAVAHQLRDMDLGGTADADHVRHKKAKLNTICVDSGASLNTAADTARDPPSPASTREVPETPQASQPRMLPDIAAFAQPTAFVSTAHSVSPHRSRSPPPSPLTWKDSEITGHVAGPDTDPDDDGTGLNGIGFRPTPALAYARAQKRRQQLSEWKLRETREARAKRSQRRQRGVGGAASRETTVEREMPVQPVSSPKRSVKFAV